MYQSPLEPKGYEKLYKDRQQKRRSRQALAIELILVVVATLFLCLAVVSVLKQKQSDERFYYHKAGLTSLEAHPALTRKGVNVNGSHNILSINRRRR